MPGRSRELLLRYSARSVRRSLVARFQAGDDKRLLRFSDAYDRLVDLLCWAAKEGPHDGRDARYAEIRSSMRRDYERLRGRLRRYVLAVDAAAAGDPFEALFNPESIDEVIHGAFSIDNLMLTRQALDRYRSEVPFSHS
jgi:hypothetical protein